MQNEYCYSVLFFRHINASIFNSEGGQYINNELIESDSAFCQHKKILLTKA